MEGRNYRVSLSMVDIDIDDDFDNIDALWLELFYVKMNEKKEKYGNGKYFSSF